MLLRRSFIGSTFVIGIMMSFSASASIKSYREWKQERVQVAQSKVSSIKAQIESKKTASKVVINSIDPNLENKSVVEGGTSHLLALDRLERQLNAEQYDLDLANDLSVTDYFVGYLIKVQDKKTAFKEVAGKLSPDEVAELMSAYATAVIGPETTSDQKGTLIPDKGSGK